MSKLQIPVFVGTQAAKPIMFGAMSASDLMTYVRSGTLAVNELAQRSLARGTSDTEPTKDLLQEDRVHKTPRVTSFVRFIRDVVARVQRNEKDVGFLGAIQLIVPEQCPEIVLDFADPGVAAASSGSLAVLNNALTRQRRLATLIANPAYGQAVAHIGDGQGRAVGLLALERTINEAITEARKRLRKLIPGSPEHEEQSADLTVLEDELKRVHQFLSDTDVPFVLYASAIDEVTGRVSGLSLNAEKRLYIEGNALNSQASKEELIKYDAFSPITVSLQTERLEHSWMDPAFIDEGHKSISTKSSKVFTLSALVQAYSLSIINDGEPFKNYEVGHFDLVPRRADFVRKFWAKVGEVFGDEWTTPRLSPSQRLEHLTFRRDQDNVAFQAVFLLGLGRIGYVLGHRAGWEVERGEFDRLDRLKTVNLVACKNPNSPEGCPGGGTAGHLGCCWDERWVAAMMKPKADKKTGAVVSYSFNNVSDTHDATFRLLKKLLGLTDETAASPDGADAATGAAA